MGTTGDIGIGVVCSAEDLGAPLTVTRRFLDKGCTVGVVEESLDKSRGGDCGGSSLSSSLIRTATGDWRVGARLWLERNACLNCRDGR